MENMISKDFKSLAHRILYSYTGTLPGFIPVKSNLASEEAQKQLYGFISSAAQKLYSNPEAIGLSLLPDEFYLNGELDNRKPKLIIAMKSMKKKIDEFYTLLINIGKLGDINDSRLFVKKSDVKFNSKLITKLKYIGLKSEVTKDYTVFWNDEYPDMFPAWKLLSNKAAENERRSVLTFSHCLFDPEYSYSKDIFIELIENKSPVHSLIEYLDKNGYKYIDSRDKELSMDWVKHFGEKNEPLKDAWAEREHGGLSVFYEYRKKNQIIFSLRIPKFKELMERFDDMDDNLKGFVTRRTKKCNNCGYCTQTDKTGKRKKQLINVTHNGSFDLCLLFPGFNYKWANINDEIAANLIRFLSFAESVLKKEVKAI